MALRWDALVAIGMLVVLSYKYECGLLFGYGRLMDCFPLFCERKQCSKRSEKRIQLTQLMT